VLAGSIKVAASVADLGEERPLTTRELARAVARLRAVQHIRAGADHVVTACRSERAWRARGDDLVAAALGDPLEGLPQGPAAARRVLGGLTSAQRSAGEPWREMCPSRARWSEVRTVGVMPAQEQRWRAVGKR
jgi:hypothetical protein